MDFTLDDEQQAIADLSDRILGERTASDAWTALAAADLLGLALPAAMGGSERGLLDAGLVARQVGRHVAQVPYWTSTAAALTIARWGNDQQRSRWLPGAHKGTDPLAVAPWASADAGVTALQDGDGWRLDGAMTPVPWASRARALVVPTDIGVFVVETTAPGVHLVDEGALTGEPTQTASFDAVPAGLALGDGNGEGVAEWLSQRTTLLLCLTMLGVCEEALAITARHVSQREQFGSPIGTFQAVAHRCADAYIDTEAVRLTSLQATWQLDAGWDGRDAVAVAAFWATEAGYRVLHAAQHLHGGIGMDTDYPLHRYFRWATSLEALLGGPHGALARLGASLSAGAIFTT
jgi:alkylation response protein AidB-like acyl-CoA dehydrogenase